MSLREENALESKKEALSVTEQVIFNAIQHFLQIQRIHKEVGLHSEDSFKQLLELLYEMASDAVLYAKVLDGANVVAYNYYDSPVQITEESCEEPMQFILIPKENNGK